MADQAGETLVRFLRMPEHLQPVPIYAPDPIRPDWLAIVFVPSTPNSVVESFVLYFLDADGNDLEFLQFDTLEIALDQANAIAGVANGDWTQCSTPIPEEWVRIRPTLFA